MSKIKGRNITSQQEKFCLEYIKTHNATTAAKRAGYSQKTAYSQGNRLLKNVEVQKRVKELSEEIEKQDIADAAEIRKTLTSFLRAKADEDVVCMVGIGQGESIIKHTRKEPSIKDRMKAAELLAKMLGVLEPQNSDGEDEGKQVVGDLTEALTGRKVTGIDCDGEDNEDDSL